VATRKKTTSGRRKRRRAPWKRPAPKGSRRTALSASRKAKAKAAAKRAGRPYPNLVDNMRVASKRPRKKKGK
jgi:hypothetical protein